MAAITQAFVLAAGLGKRLRPLTDALPKPLIPIFQKPLITFVLDHLINAGVNRFVVNTHRRPELFRSFFNRGDYAGEPVTLVHEPELLETGGGIKNAKRCLGSHPFFTYSGDIFRISLCAITALWTSRIATGSREVSISPTSLFGIQRFFSEFRRRKRFLLFRFSRIGWDRAAGSAAW